MSALTEGKQRKAIERGSDFAGQLGTTTIYAGGIVMLNASGLARPGATATGCYGVGVAQTRGGLDRWDNSAGADNALYPAWDEGTFVFANSGGGDAILSTTKPGTIVFIVDDDTVALTSNSGARSPAGRLHRLDSAGVWVTMGKNIGKQCAEQVALTAAATTFTQTYSTANATVAAQTVVAQTALTDNSGGAAADGTIAAVVDVATAADAVKELATKVNLLVTAVNALAADDLDNRQSVNAIIDVLQAANIAL